MADSKLAHKDSTEGASPAPRHKSNDDAPRSRSERKDKSKSSGSTDPAPAGNPRKLDFGNGEGEHYSPRTIEPETPYPPKQVAQLVATYEGMQGIETDGEATQRHNKEAEEEQTTAAEAAAKQALHQEAAADGYAAIEQADAAGYTAAIEIAKADEPEPIQVTKTNPFATPVAAQKEATPAVAAEQPTPNPEQIPVSTTPTKRNQNTGGEEKDDDEMEEDERDPTTLAPEVQLRKIHQTLQKFSDRMANNEESIEGQGRMIDEVAARHRQEGQERISKAYEILGIPEKANAT